MPDEARIVVVNTTPLIALSLIEVLALALEVKADLAIIDERLARRHAKRLGVPLSGSLGVLLRAKRRGLLDQVRPFIEQIRRGGIRLSDAVVEEALKLAGEEPEG